jgi:hypothetical protein
MPSGVTSVFSDAEDFAAALRAEGCLSLLVTGAGQLRARLTQLALHSLRLSATGHARVPFPVAAERSAAVCFFGISAKSE